LQFADPQALSTAYLVLRHLYDGDVIDWPVEDSHPLRQIFADLEAQGYVARWDRIWPLHDRYRLTDLGIATIEAQYRPAQADQVFNDLQGMNLKPYDRRAYLQSAGYDPVLWPILHDHSTHWSSYYGSGYRSSYYNYLWEDDEPSYRTRHHHPNLYVDQRVPDEALIPQPGPHVVDLDREAAAGGVAGGVLAGHDLDVS
jgi:hypothetical protein